LRERAAHRTLSAMPATRAAATAPALPGSVVRAIAIGIIRLLP